MSDKVCPFCDEADFDMVGLKIHLNAGDCYAFNDTPGPARTVRLGDARASRPREAGCVCGVNTAGVVHRTNGPCYYADPLAPEDHARVAADPRWERERAPEACPRCPACGATEWFNIYSYKSTDGQGHPLKVWTDSAGDGDRAECRDKWHVEEREIEGIVERTIQKIPAMLATPASAAGREGVARFIEECDERHNHRCACYAMSMENRRCDEAKSIAAIRALLAAEAEAEGGAK